VGIQDREHLEVRSARTLSSWLSKNHQSSNGLWVVTYKKVSGRPAPTYDEIVKVALSYGWIDSVPGKVDELRTKLYLSPRKKGSGWSSPNKKRIKELLDAGAMKPSGLKVLEQAKKDGSWSKIDNSENLVIPKDLISAFRRHSGSKKNFEAFPPGVRKQILQWINSAKTESTREKRINETASLAAENVRANQWRTK
jgi:uncharacterized protein YdeI (YjbR/CyaY-like superfamily)